MPSSFVIFIAFFHHHHKALRALGFYKHRHIRLTLSPHGSSSSLLMGTEGGEIGPRPSGFYTTLHCLVLKLPVASAAHRAKSEGLAGCSCSHQTPGPTQAQPPAATFPASSRAKAVGHPQPHKGTGHSDSGHISPTLHPRAWGQNQAQAQIPWSENKDQPYPSSNLPLPALSQGPTIPKAPPQDRSLVVFSR